MKKVVEMGRKSEWTQEQVEQLVQMYEEERLSIAECAVRLGKSYTNVWQKLERLQEKGKVKIRERGKGNGWTQEQIEKLVKLYGGGLSIDECAVRLGKKCASVGWMLRRLQREGRVRVRRRGRSSEWTQEQIKELVELYKWERLGIGECAARLGKSYESVRRKLKELEMRGDERVRVREKGSGEDLALVLLGEGIEKIDQLFELWMQGVLDGEQVLKMFGKLRWRISRCTREIKKWISAGAWRDFVLMKEALTSSGDSE